jgi:MFS family permease
MESDLDPSPTVPELTDPPRAATSAAPASSVPPANREIFTSFDRLVLRGVPYGIFWMSLGGMLVIPGAAILIADGSSNLVWTGVLYTGLLVVGPVVMSYYARSFVGVLSSLVPLLWRNPEDGRRWAVDRRDRVFRMSPAAAAVIVGTLCAGVGTVLVLGLPLHSDLSNGIALVAFVMLVGVMGQWAYVVIALLVALWELGRLEPRMPFYALPHPAFESLMRYYSLIALWVSAGYSAIALGVVLGPYGLSGPMLAWLSIVSVFPAGLFAWSFVQVHGLMQRTKAEYLRFTADLTQHAVAQLTDRPTAGKLGALHEAMSIHFMAQSLPEWPVALLPAMTLLIALATAIVQVAALLIGHVR